MPVDRDSEHESQAQVQPCRKRRRKPTAIEPTARLLDVNGAAGILALSPKTLYQWADERKMPTVKVGRALRFRLTTILRLIAASEIPVVGSARRLGCRNDEG